ncbi:MAG: hypothetical protein PHR81_03055 [Bacteroidales bacterium]|jgi:hypothetical protein|nr:hypothetical protein [Bacteroidales bacterium]MDD4213768.1 hypothetical protein [Bacteroidales bacterium]
MKTKIIILLTLFLAAGCTSSKKYLERGDFSMATKKAVSKLMKKPDNAKEIWVLSQAFKKANIQNTDRIEFLRKTGKPEIWEEIYQNYFQLKTRQDLVKNLPGQILASVGFEIVNYDTDLIEAEKKACDYYYALGLKLLSQNDKFSARQAYDEFMKIKKHYKDYRDLDAQINKAIALGTTNVIFYIKNSSYALLPQDFEYEFMKITLSDAETRWVRYDSKEVEGINYDYTILLNLKVIDVSPERIREKNWIESKEIQDGWTYQLDNHGNVMHDSAGNDIKIPRYIKVSCMLKEIQQNKEAVLSGKVEHYNNITKQLMNSENITANSVFSNGYLIANGDLRALSAETKKRLGNGPLPFPSDFDMIMMANEYLQKAVKNVIRNKSYLIK